MRESCECGNLIYLEEETGTPDNYYYGKCSECNRGLSIFIDAKTKKEKRRYWTEPETEVEKGD